MSQKNNFIELKKIKISSIINDTHGVMHHYSLEINDLINLSGGIPNMGIGSLDIEVNSLGQGVLAIQIVTGMYQTKRVIDFELKIINNSYMQVYERNKRVATHLFNNQVHEALAKGFRKIYTMAMGREGGKGWGGYYCWGRLGYEMIKQDHEEFIELMEQFGRKDTDLHALLASTDGQAFWLAYGFTWSGYFHLDDGHNNISYLKEYLQDVGIDLDI